MFILISLFLLIVLILAGAITLIFGNSKKNKVGNKLETG